MSRKATIVGLGLIGGSIALDLRKSGFCDELTGLDRNADHARLALQLDLVDRIVPEAKALSTADLVVLAIPVDAILVLLPTILDNIKNDAVVVDTGSTKSLICKAVNNHPRRNRFVAGHPIAGTENSGPTAAFSGLFLNKTNIICEAQKSAEDALHTAIRLFEALGMKTIFMQPDEHDRHLAYVSHLSHVSSFLLGQTVLDIEQDEKNIATLAGSGFASTVRLAKSSPDMWAPIFEQNMEYLSQALQEYILHLQRFQYYLMKRNRNEMQRTMLKANEIRRILDGIDAKSKVTSQQ
jgi:prephenate dehydrogenase